MHRVTGRYRVTTVVGNEAVQAFVPHPLPPNPPLVIDGSLRARLEDALIAVGRLDGLGRVLPDPQRLLYSFVRREAVLSSQIEGTQSSLSDLLAWEAGGSTIAADDDVREVSNYVDAMEHGLARLREGFPISLRLIRELHARVLASGRGAAAHPGEFRRSQNWIGGTRPGTARFVPPPAGEVLPCLDALERWLHTPDPAIGRLERAALAHVQFETIHPFLDGNGRVGRLLITLLLCADGLLQQPLLHLSLHFKEHRAEYYERLGAVRRDGDWEGWLGFFADGVAASAGDAIRIADRILALFSTDRDRLRAVPRATAAMTAAWTVFQTRPVLSVAQLAARIDSTIPRATRALDRLMAAGLVSELTGRRRDRLFAYTAYLDLLRDRTDAPFPNR